MHPRKSLCAQRDFHRRRKGDLGTYLLVRNRAPRYSEIKHALIFSFQSSYQATRPVFAFSRNLAALFPAQFIILMQPRQLARGDVQRFQVFALDDLHDRNQPRDGRLGDIVDCGGLQRQWLVWIVLGIR